VQPRFEPECHDAFAVSARLFSPRKVLKRASAPSETGAALVRWRGKRLFDMKPLTGLFRRDASGAALVEYAMLAGLIAAVCVAAGTLFGTTISSAFTAYAAVFSVL
jgi:Flp pilus assembly pilin Flp